MSSNKSRYWKLRKTERISFFFSGNLAIGQRSHSKAISNEKKNILLGKTWEKGKRKKEKRENFESPKDHKTVRP